MNDLLKNKANFVRTVLLAVVATFVMSSCNDDDDKVYVYRPANYISMGVVNEKGRIETDKGNVLIPDESSVKHELTEGERVFLNCHILKEVGENMYKVRINDYYQLLTKNFIRSSDSEESELGDAPIHIEKGWFGGGYLNMLLALKHNASSGISHSVNLVYDEVTSTADTVRFVLRHHPNGDTEHTVTGRAYASFNMKDLSLEDNSKVYVSVKWRWYNPHGVIVEHEDGGYYTLSEKQNEDDEESMRDENVNIQ